MKILENPSEIPLERPLERPQARRLDLLLIDHEELLLIDPSHYFAVTRDMCITAPGMDLEKIRKITNTNPNLKDQVSASVDPEAYF